MALQVYHNGNPKSNSKTESFQFLRGMYISDSNRICLKKMPTIQTTSIIYYITPNHLRHILPNAPQTNFLLPSLIHITSHVSFTVSEYINKYTIILEHANTYHALLISAFVTYKDRNMCPCCFSCEFSKTCFMM